MEGFDRIQEDLDKAIAVLKGCGKVFFENRQRVAAMGGLYLASAAEAAAPRSKKPHIRYSTRKLTKKLRAPKGYGTPTAIYYPGNLARSFKVFHFKRAKSKVFVGANLNRGSKGTFKGNRTDGWYLHFVEDGTKAYKGRSGQAATNFYKNTWERSKGRVYKIMLSEFQRIGAKFEQQNAIR